MELNRKYTPKELGFTFISSFGQLNKMEYSKSHSCYCWICPDCGSEVYRYYVYYGRNGAYNLYESEMRANLIISELTKVVASLEDIKKNQFMLYSELRNINSTLHSLGNSMDAAVKTLQSIDASAKRCAENSNIIAHNTAVTAYYSKMNAELTDALGYMVAFK